MSTQIDLKNKFYFSVVFMDNLTKRYTKINNDSDSNIYLNGIYANKLNINHGEHVYFKYIQYDYTFATSIMIKPVSLDDWQILELNLDYIQNNLLNQIKVVFLNQIFPIWIDSDVCIFVKTISFDSESQNFTLNSSDDLNTS